MTSEGVLVRVCGQEATYRGRVYPVLFVGTDAVGLPYAGPGPGDPEFPDEIGFQSGNRPEWVRIPTAALDRNVKFDVTASWRGERVWLMNSFDDGTVGFYYQGSADFAREHELSGDQYNGWGGRVPEAELDDVRVEEKELPR